jgi:hypothetical protein
MTFIDRIESLSARFLSERTHELIVAPAIADLQYDSGDTSPDARGRFSVIVALAGAAYEELTSDLRLLKIAGLALIPAIYYSFLFILVIPPDVGTQLSAHWGRFAIASGVTLLSFGPVLACCWPERLPRKPPQMGCPDHAGDA